MRMKNLVIQQTAKELNEMSVSDFLKRCAVTLLDQKGDHDQLEIILQIADSNGEYKNHEEIGYLSIGAVPSSIVGLVLAEQKYQDKYHAKSNLSLIK